MERFADLVLLPISLFSGKPLAVSIALLILLAVGGLYAVIYFLFEKSFLAAYDEATKAVATARRRDPAQTRANTNVGAALAQPKFAELWDQYRASFDFSGNDAFNYTDPAAFFDGDRLEGHNYPKWSTTLGGVFLTVGLFFTFVDGCAD